MPSSRGFSQRKDRNRVSCVFCIADRFFTAKPLGKPYVLDIKTLSDIICKYFLLFTRLFFHFIDSLTCSAKLLIVSHYFILLFFSPFPGGRCRKLLLRLMSKSVLPVFPSVSFIAGAVTMWPLIYFELIFVYSVR